MRTLVATGVLVGKPGAYRLAQALPTIQVPATVQAVLAARIDRLPPEEKRLLQTASVVGTEVPFPLLQASATSCASPAAVCSAGELPKTLASPCFLVVGWGSGYRTPAVRTGPASRPRRMEPNSPRVFRAV